MTETEQPSITCPRCNFTSYHPKDIEYGWCGNCHEFTSPGRQTPSEQTYTFAAVLGWEGLTEQGWLEAYNRLQMAYADEDAPRPTVRLFGYGAARTMLEAAKGRFTETALLDALLHDKSDLVLALRGTCTPDENGNTGDPVQVLRDFIRESVGADQFPRPETPTEGEPSEAASDQPEETADAQDD